MIQLIKGDCLDIMQTISDNSIDMILCDLPYGITNCKWDRPLPLDQLWKQYNRIIKDNGVIALFAKSPFNIILGNSNLKNLRYELIWEKTQATGFLNAKRMPLSAHENILIFYKKAPIYNPQKTQGHKPVNNCVRRAHSINKTELYKGVKHDLKGGGNTDRYPRSVLKFSSDKQKCSLHPAQKPVALLEYLIKTYTNEGMTVLDNTMGCGSTGIACLNTNRQFIGIEIEKKYFGIATDRIWSEWIGHRGITQKLKKDKGND